MKIMRIFDPIFIISNLINKIPNKSINILPPRVMENKIFKPVIEKLDLDTLNKYNKSIINSNYTNYDYKSSIPKFNSKISSLIKITRFYTMFSIIILNSVSNFIQKRGTFFLFSTKMMKIHTITVLFAFASYVINDCLDYQVDLINKPNGILQQKLLSLKEAYTFSAVLFLSGLMLSKTMNSSIQYLTYQNCILLVFYTPFFKKITFIKNVLCSFVTANSVLMSSLPYVYPNWFSIFNSRAIATQYFYLSVFLMTMYNEINYDIRDVKGDKEMNIYTLPVKYGVENSRNISKLFKFLAYLFILYTTLALQY